MTVSLKQGWQAIQVEVAAFVLKSKVKEQLAGIVNEAIAVHATVLLTLEVDSFFQARCQPGTDGFRVVVA